MSSEAELSRARLVWPCAGRGSRLRRSRASIPLRRSRVICMRLCPPGGELFPSWAASALIGTLVGVLVLIFEPVSATCLKKASCESDCRPIASFLAMSQAEASWTSTSSALSSKLLSDFPGFQLTLRCLVSSNVSAVGVTSTCTGNMCELAPHTYMHVCDYC